MNKITVIDSHTGGEPTRVVLDGFPDLAADTDGPRSVAEQLETLKNHHDHWRRRCILEPRGNDILVGALLLPPVEPDSVASVIFFNNDGYLGMCGHGTIGLVVTLAYLGRIAVGKHRIDTPVGTVTAELHADGSVSVDNVASYRYRQALSVAVPGYGQVVGDIAWGGNWFFLISDHGFELNIRHSKTLLDYTIAVQKALLDNGIRGEDGGIIDHVELFAASDTADSKNFVLCPGGEYDRSPCGTGTSAKLACLAADDKLQPGQIWRQNSILDTQFEGSYRLANSNSDDENGYVLPTIKGNAYICAETTLIVDANDPLLDGVVKK